MRFVKVFLLLGLLVASTYAATTCAATLVTGCTQTGCGTCPTDDTTHAVVDTAGCCSCGSGYGGEPAVTGTTPITAANCIKTKTACTGCGASVVCKDADATLCYGKCAANFYGGGTVLTAAAGACTPVKTDTATCGTNHCYECNAAGACFSCASTYFAAQAAKETTGGYGTATITCANTFTTTSCDANSNCYECQVGTLTQCVTCKDGYYPSSTIVPITGGGYGNAGVTCTAVRSMTTATKCANNCAECTTGDVCFTCATGYYGGAATKISGGGYVSSAGAVCAKIVLTGCTPAGCKSSCDTAKAKCFQCDPGYYGGALASTLGGDCTQIKTSGCTAPGCKTSCTSDGTTGCFVCDAGFYGGAANTADHPNGEACNAVKATGCSATGGCKTSCNTDGTKCFVCDAGFYGGAALTTLGGTCTAVKITGCTATGCKTSCTNDLGSCFTCDAGFYGGAPFTSTTGGACTAVVATGCPTGCTDCDSSKTLCFKCATGFYGGAAYSTLGGSCAAIVTSGCPTGCSDCDTAKANCFTCASGYTGGDAKIMTGAACTKAASGTSCDASCGDCSTTNKLNCYKCATGFFSAKNGNYSEVAGLACTAALTTGCDSSCTDCVTGSTALCFTCATGFNGGDAKYIAGAACTATTTSSSTTTTSGVALLFNALLVALVALMLF